MLENDRFGFSDWINFITIQYRWSWLYCFASGCFGTIESSKTSMICLGKRNFILADIPNLFANCMEIHCFIPLDWILIQSDVMGSEQGSLSTDVSADIKFSIRLLLKILNNTISLEWSCFKAPYQTLKRQSNVIYFHPDICNRNHIL